MVSGEIRGKLDELPAEKRPKSKGALYTVISEMIHKHKLLLRKPETGPIGPVMLTDKGRNALKQLLEEEKLY